MVLIEQRIKGNRAGDDCISRAEQIRDENELDRLWRRWMMKRKILRGGFGLLTMAGIVMCFVILQARAASEEVAPEKVISQEEEAKFYTKQGDDYFKQGSYNKAIEEYKMALKFKPYVYTYRQLGNAYLNIGDYKNAEIQYKEAIRISPKVAILYYNLSYIYGKEGNYDEVISICNRGLEVNPNQVNLLNNLSDAYMKKGLYEEAKATIEKALAIQPNLAVAHSTYGEIYEKLGEYAKALEEFKEVKSDSEYGSVAQEKILKINELIKNTKGNTNN